MLWQRHESKHPGSPGASRWTSSKLVIEYNNFDDLLARLREVKTYREIELRHVGPPVQTGIACTDTAGRQAYQQSQEATARAIDDEVQRINSLPH